jgi:hypothetical protein
MTTPARLRRRSGPGRVVATLGVLLAAPPCCPAVPHVALRRAEVLDSKGGRLALIEG